jgi:hypothetical protein
VVELAGPKTSDLEDNNYAARIVTMRGLGIAVATPPGSYPGSNNMTPQVPEELPRRLDRGRFAIIGKTTPPRNPDDDEEDEEEDHADEPPVVGEPD